MSILSIIFIGLAMSTDAFAAAIGKGIAMRKPSLLQALRVGLIFGVIEAITPVIGWFIGRAATQYVAEWDHWIALALLAGLGLHMIYAGFTDSDAPPQPRHKLVRQSFWALALTGFATSIDAMAVGVSLALLEVNIALVAIIIGICTFTMVTIGVLLGRMLGVVVGRYAEIFGGVVLIGIGIAIVFDHSNMG